MRERDVSRHCLRVAYDFLEVVISLSPQFCDERLLIYTAFDQKQKQTSKRRIVVG